MEFWLIVMVVLIVLQIAGMFLFFEGKGTMRGERSGTHDPSRASWTSSAMQDAMDQGE